VPNFLSLRQNFTRSLDCFAGKLKSKNSQEGDIFGGIAVAVGSTCDLSRFILIRVPVKVVNCLARAAPVADDYPPFLFASPTSTMRMPSVGIQPFKPC
jgi:hypothetical protein